MGTGKSLERKKKGDILLCIRHERIHTICKVGFDTVYDNVWLSLGGGGIATYSSTYKDIPKDKRDDYFSGNYWFKVAVGGAYKYWLAEKLYVEGRAGLGYWVSRLNKNTDSDGDVYLTLQPRLGWKFAKHWGVFAGGQFDFYKLKFKTGYNKGYGVIGVAYHF